ncbi:hypothetical protein ACFOZY_03770 [Chungangia koreensis]|uniref:Uncharacterized protein n=1 Tax=Chungangia koreensis TaxID=752657 RepID=A0ABV8X0W8_9LACT
MQKTEMYQPSLQQGWEETKSFDIHRLFLVGFFGGAIPLIIMGSMNAKWVRLSNKRIVALALLGSLVVIGKYLVLLYMMQNSLTFDSSSMRIGYRVSCVLLYGAYFFALRKAFNSHRYLGGEMVPMLGTAIKWSLVGIGIETIITATIINL